MSSLSSAPLLQSSLQSLPFLHRGKVRDIYGLGDERLLIIQTDRISAFDVILGDPIPGKGAVLTRLSEFWFDKLYSIIPNHTTGIRPESVVSVEDRAQVEGRGMVVKKMKPLKIEAIVRGYIIGSGWKDYQKTGAVCGITLPKGLQEAQGLPEPLFTPSTKADAGEHDENISYATAEKIIGVDYARIVREASLRLYHTAAEHARQRGIIIADTKFEFGVDTTGKVHLIDEVMTPDSSRFWPMDQYQIGRSPPSFDKQYVRDWLEQQTWNKKSPAPPLPQNVIAQTTQKYNDALERLIKNLD